MSVRGRKIVIVSSKLVLKIWWKNFFHRTQIDLAEAGPE